MRKHNHFTIITQLIQQLKIAIDSKLKIDGFFFYPSKPTVSLCMCLLSLHLLNYSKIQNEKIYTPFTKIRTYVLLYLCNWNDSSSLKLQTLSPAKWLSVLGCQTCPQFWTSQSAPNGNFWTDDLIQIVFVSRQSMLLLKIKRKFCSIFFS